MIRRGNDCTNTFLFGISKCISAMRRVEWIAPFTDRWQKGSRGRWAKSIRRSRIKCSLLGGPRRLRGRRRLAYSRPVGTVCFGRVKYVVEYGLAHRNLDGIRQIGIDEISYGGHKYLTLVYQLDKASRRLLERTEAKSERPCSGSSGGSGMSGPRCSNTFQTICGRPISR